ncbi:MAG: hypothetical protein ACREBC_34885, partial [Pyrinomonadaceae bacterium]
SGAVQPLKGFLTQRGRPRSAAPTVSTAIPTIQLLAKTQEILKRLQSGGQYVSPTELAMFNRIR